MRSRRIIPQLLLKGTRLVKGTRFEDHVDVGDPVSQAMIFDAQGAEEIVIVDIEATGEGRTISPELIREIILKCRLPIAAGGGISSVSDAEQLFRSGADKIVVNTAAMENGKLVQQLANQFGSQSVLVSLDVMFLPGDNDWEVVVNSGRKRTGIMIREALKKVIESGAGEILLTSIDREGTLEGFDFALFGHVRDSIPVPFIVGGGAGSYDHIVELFKSFDADACGLGKMLALRDYDIVRIKSYIHGRGIPVREA